MPSSPIPNNPAGRLRDVFNKFHTISGGPAPRPLGRWWHDVAEEMCSEGDVYTFRAEAGALLRDVERAGWALPAEDNPDSLLATRGTWAVPIFGWGLYDGANKSYAAHDLIPVPAIRELGALAGHLRRDAPEFEFVGDPVQLSSDLAEVDVRLRDLLDQVLEDKDLPEPSRRYIVRALMVAREDITYVRLRGLGRLHHHVTAAHAESVVAVEDVAAKHHLVVVEQPGRVQRLRDLSAALLDLVVNVERIVVPTATTISVAIATKDIVLALGAGTASRYMIGASAGAEPKQITSGELGASDSSS